MTYQIIIALVIASMGFGSAWTIQDWRYGSMEVKRAEQKLADVRQSAARDIRIADNTIQAQSEAAKRVAALRRDADTARSALDRLQSDSADALRTSSASLEACTQYAATSSKLFDQCGARLQEVARDADAWQSNALMLDQSWPE